MRPMHCGKSGVRSMSMQSGPNSVKRQIEPREHTTMTSRAHMCRIALKTRSVLGVLTDDALDLLVGRGWLMAYATGAAVYRSGDEATDSLLIVLSGRIEVVRRLTPARSLRLRVLGPGDVDGELAVLDGGPRMADAIAVEAAEAMILYRQDIRQVLEQNPAAMADVIAALSSKIRTLSAGIEETNLRTIGQVAHGLLRLADQHGRPLPDGILIDVSLSQNELARHTSLEREAANRQLVHLRDLGLIRAEGARIVILDRDALQDYAEAAGA